MAASRCSGGCGKVAISLYTRPAKSLILRGRLFADFTISALISLHNGPLTKPLLYQLS